MTREGGNLTVLFLTSGRDVPSTRYRMMAVLPTGRGIHEYLEMPYTNDHAKFYKRTMHRKRLGTKVWSGFKWRVMAIKKGFQVMFE